VLLVVVLVVLVVVVVVVVVVVIVVAATLTVGQCHLSLIQTEVHYDCELGCFKLTLSNLYFP
jgi:hypothetical protein